MAITITRSNNRNYHPDEFSAKNYRGFRKTDVAQTVLLALPNTATSTVLVLPMVDGKLAKALYSAVPPLKGLGYKFLKDTADALKWGSDFQYFGHSAFVV